MDPGQLKMIVENSENPSFVMNMEMKNLTKQFKKDNLQEDFKLDLDPIMMELDSIKQINLQRLTDIAQR